MGTLNAETFMGILNAESLVIRVAAETFVVSLNPWVRTRRTPTDSCVDLATPFIEPVGVL